MRPTKAFRQRRRELCEGDDQKAILLGKVARITALADLRQGHDRISKRKGE
jgi:hypothetical protein